MANWLESTGCSGSSVADEASQEISCLLLTGASLVGNIRLFPTKTKP